MRRNVLVSSTSSLVNGPQYLFFPRSIQRGISSSQYNVWVKALRCSGSCVSKHFVNVLQWNKLDFHTCPSATTKYFKLLSTLRLFVFHEIRYFL